MSCHDARIMDGTNISQGNKSLNSSPHHNNSQYNTGTKIDRQTDRYIDRYKGIIMARHEKKSR